MNDPTAENTTFGIWNKVPYWVDFLIKNADQYDPPEELCVSKIDLF